MTSIYDQSHRPEMAKTVERFASIGVNCEFGLIQRWCAIEPLGLFRFGLTPLSGLITALHESFAGIDEPGLIELTTGWGDEYVTRHALYGFEFHTGMQKGTVDEADLLRKLSRERFPLLARMLREDLASGDKLLVFRAEEPGQDAEARRLFAAIRMRGPASLLWVTLARDASQVGTVSRLGDGLLIGYLDRLAPLRFAAGLSFEPWLSVCTAAHAAWTDAAPPL